MHKNNTVLVVLTAISLLCLLVLLGGYRYTGGTILPQTQNATPAEVQELLFEWSSLVIIPVVTSVLWAVRLWTRRGK